MENPTYRKAFDIAGEPALKDLTEMKVNKPEKYQVAEQTVTE